MGGTIPWTEIRSEEKGGKGGATETLLRVKCFSHLCFLIVLVVLFFPVAAIKHSDKSNLRQRRFTPVPNPGA